LPESLDFLVRTNAKPESVWRVVRSLDSALPNQNPRIFINEVEEKRSAISSLFQSERTLGTLVLWLVFGLNLAEFYALQSWLPTILTNLGHSLNTVALATSLTTIGGIAAALVIGPAMDRLGPYGSLATVYFAGVVFVALLGLAVSAPSWVLLFAAFCAGFCISGGQKSVIALAAIFYPAPIRSTGVGWALGIGRLGGIGGPLLIGVLLAYQLSAASLFMRRPSRCCWPAFWSCCWASNTRRRERAVATVQFFDSVSVDTCIGARWPASSQRTSAPRSSAAFDNAVQVF
jgi:MFS transporter, AAHS family, 4-hydroxybenzoate transporter